MIDHLIYKEDIKLFAENREKKLETMIQKIRIYRQDIGMKFGRDKCAMPIIKKIDKNT